MFGIENPSKFPLKGKLINFHPQFGGVVRVIDFIKKNKRNSNLSPVVFTNGRSNGWASNHTSTFGNRQTNFLPAANRFSAQRVRKEQLKMTQSFWGRWSADYLSSLIPRKRWKKVEKKVELDWQQFTCIALALVAFIEPVPLKDAMLLTLINFILCVQIESSMYVSVGKSKWIYDK